MNADQTSDKVYFSMYCEMKKKFRHFGAIPLFALYGCTANADFCELTGDNYLQNSDFSATTAAGSALHWTPIQHAGEHSFEVSYEGEEVTINKIGTQSWLMLKQRLRDTDLGGKKAALTAEIKLDLEAPAHMHSFKQGGGLQLTATSSSSPRLLLKSTLDHTPRMGKTDWEKVQVIVKFPKKASTVEVSLLHQADGVLQVRNPSLRLVDESQGKCKKTRISKQ